MSCRMSTLIYRGLGWLMVKHLFLTMIIYSTTYQPANAKTSGMGHVRINLNPGAKVFGVRYDRHQSSTLVRMRGGESSQVLETDLTSTEATSESSPMSSPRSADDRAITSKRIRSNRTKRQSHIENILPMKEIQENQKAHLIETRSDDDTSYYRQAIQSLPYNSNTTIENSFYRGYNVCNGTHLPDFDTELRSVVGDDLIQITNDPILSNEECQSIIDSAEDHFYRTNNGKWSTLPSGRYEVAGSWIKDIPTLHDFFNKLLKERFYPALSSLFPGILQNSDDELCVQSSYIFKYTPTSGSKTDIHTDSSLLSFTLLLSPPEDFKGGGTYFECLGKSGQVLDMKRGDVTFRPAGLRHAGYPVTEGVRYVIGGFVTMSGKGGCEHVRQLLNRANSALLQKDPQQCQALLKLALKLNPRYWDLYMTQGQCLRELGDLEGALRSYQQAFMGNGRNSDAAFMVGSVNVELKRDDEAWDWFEIARDLNPHDGEAYYRMALLASRKSLQPSTIEKTLLQKCLELDPKHVDAHTNLGVYYGEVEQNTKQEVACYERALDIEPTNADAEQNAKAAYYQLGVAMYKTQHFEECLEAWKRLLELDPHEEKVKQMYHALNDKWKERKRQMEGGSGNS